MLSLPLTPNKNTGFTSNGILRIFLILTLIKAVLCNLGCIYSTAAVEMFFVFLGNRNLFRAGVKALMDVKGTNCHELLQWGRWKQWGKSVKDESWEGEVLWVWEIALLLACLLPCSKGKSDDGSCSLVMIQNCFLTESPYLPVMCVFFFPVFQLQCRTGQYRIHWCCGLVWVLPWERWFAGLGKFPHLLVIEWQTPFAQVQTASRGQAHNCFTEKQHVNSHIVQGGVYN